MLPVGRGGGAVDRTSAGTAMALAPFIGLLLGAVAGAVGLGLRSLGAPTLVAAAVTSPSPGLLTRGLHLDGLADTVDGLGSYRDAAGALEIMRRPDIGPFGVAAIVLVLLAQVAAVAELLARPGRPRWPGSSPHRRGTARDRAGLPAGRAGGAPGRARRPGGRHGRTAGPRGRRGSPWRGGGTGRAGAGLAGARRGRRRHSPWPRS